MVEALLDQAETPFVKKVTVYGIVPLATETVAVTEEPGRNCRPAVGAVTETDREEEYMYLTITMPEPPLAPTVVPPEYWTPLPPFPVLAAAFAWGEAGNQLYSPAPPRA